MTVPAAFHKLEGAASRCEPRDARQIFTKCKRERKAETIQVNVHRRLRHFISPATAAACLSERPWAAGRALISG